MAMAAGTPVVDDATRESLKADYKLLLPLNHMLETVKVKIHSLRVIADSHREYPPSEELEKVKQELESFLELEKSLNKTRDTLRTRINEASRRFIRPIRIVDLPQEILLEIWKLVEGDIPVMYNTNENIATRRNTIKHCRLTCRQFHWGSSQLLLCRAISTNHPTECQTEVYLDYSADSLSRLEDISRHPLINRGVHTVEFRLCAYHETLAKDFAAFVSFAITRLSVLLAESNGLGDGPNKCSTQRQDEAKDILHCWGRLLDLPEYTQDLPDPNPGETEIHKTLLRRAYQEYWTRYHHQRSSINKEDFLRAAGIAIARMPHLRTLKFTDNAPGQRVPYEEYRPDLTISLLYSDQTVSDIVYGFTSSLPPWEDLTYGDLDSDMSYFISRLVAKVSTARLEFNYRPLESLVVSHSCHSDIDVSQLPPCPEIWQSFVSGVENLKAFRFECRGGLFDDQDNLNHLNRFLQPCIASPRLQSLVIDLHNDVGPRLSGANLALPLMSQRIESVKLSGVTFDLSALNLFLSRLPSSRPTEVDLEYPRLLSGTWASALERLRATRKRNGGELFLWEVLGGECDDLPDDQY